MTFDDELNKPRGCRFVVNLGEEIVTGRRPKYPTRWNQFEEEGVDRRFRPEARRSRSFLCRIHAGPEVRRNDFVIGLADSDLHCQRVEFLPWDMERVAVQA